MSQQKERLSPTSKRGQLLDNVIDSLTEIKNSPLKRQQSQAQDPMNLDNLYKKAGTMIQNLDVSINRCIRTHFDRSQLNYINVINDLQVEIKKLSQKLKLQQDARSPTKKHISDILDKLVIFRDQNHKLKQEIRTKDQRINELEKLLNQQTKALQKIQIDQPKTIIERLPPVSATGTVCEAIKSYLKDKEVVKKITNKSTSKLEKFLSQSKAKSWNWTVPVLLQELQKWSQGVNPEKNQVDMWKIRSNIARKFSDYIDDSGNLTKPSRLNSLSNTQQNTPRQLNLQTSRRLQGYSSRGSKQKLNFSFV